MGNLLWARFVDSIFDESSFPPLEGMTEREKELDFAAQELLVSRPDPRTLDSEREVQKLLHLKSIADNLPDAFNDASKVTQSHVPARNAPIRLHPDLPNVHIKRARGKEAIGMRKNIRKSDERHVHFMITPTSLNDLTCREDRQNDLPYSKLTTTRLNDLPCSLSMPRQMELSSDILNTSEAKALSTEISINYNHTGDIWNRESLDFDDCFSYHVANHIELIEANDPKTVLEASQRPDWPKWQEAMKSELESLKKRGVFGPVETTPSGVKPVGCKWIFVKKFDGNGRLSRYKARLVAQGFSQRPGIDYEITYSPVMDSTTFKYLISLAVSASLKMNLMDVVTAYLYGHLDTDIYMKVPAGVQPQHNIKDKDMCVKLMRSLYGLKQAGRMWYNRLKVFLETKGFKTCDSCPCIFILKNGVDFVIIAVYVDDINMIGTPMAIHNAQKWLSSEFEMKDLGTTSYCLGLQLTKVEQGIFLHQTLYTQKILKKFAMDFAHPLSSPMVVRSLDKDQDPFRPREEGEDILGEEVPYLAAIGALTYLANRTRPDIAFAVNLLARYNKAPTIRHWNDIKHIFRYLKGTQDLGLLYTNDCARPLEGYADAGYLSDPHDARSQTGYVFLRQGAAISWESSKQTITATSTNHAEIIALHEATKECIWLRFVDKFVMVSTGLMMTESPPTTIFEDNAACITQVQKGFIKGKNTKHISPKMFFTHDVLGKEVNIQMVKSSDNLADIFTKSLPTYIHKRLVYEIGMRHLLEITT